jgi:CubicO group peptidase (beta-lactamase class C family)
MRGAARVRGTWLVALGIVLGVLLVSPGSARGQSLEARVDGVFGRWATEASPGCAVGASVAGETILARAYGMAELEHGVPNRPGTIFEAGSVSKQLTAAAVVLLALDGALSLDDDVRRWVPELPDYGPTITVRHLLNHTSGLRDWGSVAALSGWGRSERSHTHAHVLEILARQTALNYEPGREYSYTNSGYNLLAVMVERVSGQSFADFSRERIFEPLGLGDTQWRDDYRRIVPGRATAYAPRGDGFIIDRPIEHVHGNGGLLTTVADLLRWDRAVAAGGLGADELGGAAFVRLMHEQGVLNDGETIAYAAGLVIGDRDGVPQVSHTGATSGYRAFLGRYPEQDLSVALLCNVGSVNPGTVGGQVVDLLLEELGARSPSRLGRPAAPPAQAPPAQAAGAREPEWAPSPGELEAYAGRYHSPDADATYRLTVEGDSLVLAVRAGDRIVLSPVAPDEFRGPGTFRFHRGADGGVTELSVGIPRVYDMRFYRVKVANP